MVANRQREKSSNLRRPGTPTPVASMMFDHPSSLTVLVPPAFSAAQAMSPEPPSTVTAMDQVQTSKLSASAAIRRRRRFPEKDQAMRAAKEKIFLPRPTWNCATLCLEGAQGYGAVQHSVCRGMAGSRPFTWRRSGSGANSPCVEPPAGQTPNRSSTVHVLDLRNLPEGDYYFSSKNNRLYDCSAFSAALPAAAASQSATATPTTVGGRKLKGRSASVEEGARLAERKTAADPGPASAIVGAARAESAPAVGRQRRGADPVLAWSIVNPRVFTFPEGRAWAESRSRRAPAPRATASIQQAEGNIDANQNPGQRQRPSSVSSAPAAAGEGTRGPSPIARPKSSLSYSTEIGGPGGSCAADRVQIIPKPFSPQSLPPAKADSSTSKFPARPESANALLRRSVRRPPVDVKAVPPDTPGPGGPSPWPAGSEDHFLM